MSAREKASDIPVIFLTAYDDEVNVVMGLDMGRMIILQNLSEFVNSFQELNRYTAATIAIPETKQIEIKNIQINILDGKVYKNGEEIY